MAFENITVKFTGISPLLQNNPQMVDPFNHYAKLKTEEGLLAIRKIEVEAKVYLDNELGVYVPSRWVLAAIAKNSYAIVKISKEKVRGAVLTVSDKCKLFYDGMEVVKTKEDISGNGRFVTLLLLPQQQSRVAKDAPIFHNWSFECELEFDNTIIDKADFGDFRPTYGRALCEVI